jgi:hypothetical protein
MTAPNRASWADEYDSVVNPSGCIGLVGDDVGLLAKRPDAAAVPAEEERFVERSNKPLREEAEVEPLLLVDAMGGAGGFVSLFRFLPNFFFVVNSEGIPPFLWLELILEMRCITTPFPAKG